MSDAEPARPLRHRRRVAAIAAALAIVVGAAYGAYWDHAAAMLREALADWAEARRAEGYTVVYSDIAVSGFPLRLDATVTAPGISGTSRDLTWRWAADDLVASVRPWRFDRLTVRLPQRQSTTYARGGESERDVDIVLGRGIAYLDLAAGGLDRLRLAGRDLTLSVSEGTVSAGRLNAMGRHDGNGLAITVDIGDLTLPARAESALGREIARLRLEAIVTGPLTGTPGAEALEAWREAGGTVEVGALNLRWGKLAIQSSGTVALDGELRPLAALTARIAGWGAAIEALSEGGAMKPRDAALATIILNLAAKPGADGRPSLKLPVTAQNGRLFVGPVKLVRLAPLFTR